MPIGIQFRIKFEKRRIGVGGIGSGRNSGGNNGGAGRPRGSINHKTRAVILAAERDGKLLPLDYLLGILRDPEASARDLAFCAVAALPFCHPRLSMLRVFPSTDHLDDAALLMQVAQFEKAAAAMPAPERLKSLEDRFHQMFEELREFRPAHRKGFLHKLADEVVAEMQELAGDDQPGTPPPRPNGPITRPL
jgi:hypothetical protein